VLVDQVQVASGQEAMVVPEAAGERLGELGDLGTQTPFGQLGELGGVALPGDQRVGASGGPTPR